MIERKDICDYFDAEAEAAEEKWKALMKLPVKDRVRKCKAIQNVHLDRGFIETSPEGDKLFKVKYTSNLSDFKEGDYLLLHKNGDNSGIHCTLNRFGEDHTIIVSISPYKMPGNLDDYYDKPLLLDKDLVDLRTYVYSNFTAQLPSASEFWDNCILNTCPEPTFEDEDTHIQQLDAISKFLKLKLTTRQKEAIVKSTSASDYYLIQGPPGTGKSFVLGLVIIEEICFARHKVIVIGPNHKAINNTLEQVLKLAPTFPALIKVGQSYNEPDLKVKNGNKEYEITKIQRLNSQAANNIDSSWVIGLTVHSLYTSRAHGLECDTLVIDEAGQMTIPLALMGIIKAKKVILAGDHKQLSPIVTADKQPEELKQSVFQKLITEHNCTMLDTSFRMCKPICDFVSELFYGGKVKAKKEGADEKIVCADEIYSFTSPIIFIDVDDHGEQTSDKEAIAIATIITGYLNKGLKPTEVAAITPFRAQAANIKRHLKKKMKDDGQYKQVAVDTVDKMQGQEREVILYSLTSGDPAYIAEMSDFLYNPNKLNVAFSRAKSKLIIIGNREELQKLDKTSYPHINRMITSRHVKHLDIRKII